MFKHWRRRRQLKKVVEGDGSQLPPFRWYHGLGRSTFIVDLVEGAPESKGQDGGAEQRPVRYSVDVRYFADDADSDFDWTFGVGEVLRNFGAFGGTQEKSTRRNAPPAALYRDGIQTKRANLPATFEVPGGYVEVAATMYGLSRMHLVREDGSEQVLRPAANSPEGLRARFGTRFPLLNRLVGVLAVIVLLGGLAIAVPQILELITTIPQISARIGTFESPIHLPVWVNVTVTGLTIVAAFERALTLRNHWLIDFDTTWLWGA